MVFWFIKQLFSRSCSCFFLAQAQGKVFIYIIFYINWHVFKDYIKCDIWGSWSNFCVFYFREHISKSTASRTITGSNVLFKNWNKCGWKTETILGSTNQGGGDNFKTNGTASNMHYPQPSRSMASVTMGNDEKRRRPRSGDILKMQRICQCLKWGKPLFCKPGGCDIHKKS